MKKSAVIINALPPIVWILWLLGGHFGIIKSPLVQLYLMAVLPLVFSIINFFLSKSKEVLLKLSGIFLLFNTASYYIIGSFLVTDSKGDSILNILTIYLVIYTVICELVFFAIKGFILEIKVNKEEERK